MKCENEINVWLIEYLYGIYRPKEKGIIAPKFTRYFL